MNREALESKVAQLLNKSEQEKSEVFSIFKEKIADFLKVGEAVKIDSLGVFQLKEQLAHSDSEKPLHSAEKAKTLVYSPESGEASGDSLFMNLELEKKIKDDTEFDENVFQLGIGKPVATISDKETLDSDQAGNVTEALEKSIGLLLNDSEKLQDFDLWEDYLKNKETKSVLDEETVIDEVVDSVTDADIEVESKKSLLDDFEPLGEEEILDKYIEDNDFINDEDVNKIVDEIDKVEPEFEIPSDELISDEIEESFEEPAIDTQDILDELNEGSDDIEEKITQKVEDEIENVEQESDVDIDDLESIKDETIMEEFSDEINAEMNEEIVNKEDSLDEELKVDEPEELKDDDIVKEEIAEFKKKGEVRYIHAKKRRGPVIYLLIAAFVLIGAIGIYYLFFDNPTWLYDQHEVEVQLSQQHAEELEDARLKALEEKNGNLEDTENVDGDKTDTEQPSEGNDDAIETQKEVKEAIAKTEDKTSKPKEATTESKKDNTSNSEEEVAENIYYDGNVYNVQVSSWKQEKFAKLEISKLEKKGFSAFFVKVFIPKFNSEWHRVRIGPFTSLKAAKENQKKLKK